MIGEFMATLHTTQTTFRLEKGMAKTLAIHKALTGESTNALIVRLLEQYFAGEGGKRLEAAGYDQASMEFMRALDQLAVNDKESE